MRYRLSRVLPCCVLIRGTNQYAKDAARASGEGVCIRYAGGMFCVRSECIGTTFNIRCEASAVLRTGRMVDTSPPSWELRSARQRFDVLRRLTFAASTDLVNHLMTVVSNDDACCGKSASDRRSRKRVGEE